MGTVIVLRPSDGGGRGFSSHQAISELSIAMRQLGESIARYKNCLLAEDDPDVRARMLSTWDVFVEGLDGLKLCRVGTPHVSASEVQCMPDQPECVAAKLER